MKRNNFRNLFSLLLVVLALYLLDNTKLNKYIGYEKVKEYIKEDIDVFGVAKGFFGERLKLFYNTEQSVSSTVIKEEKYGKGYRVYLSDDLLYSSYIGTVIKICRDDNYYSIVISKSNGKILISNLIDVKVSLYEKIEADTLLGIIDGFYYYEEI
jgi:hypothetical protein